MQTQKVSSGAKDFDIDDYIGMESCVYLKEHHTAADMSPPTNFSKGNGKRDNKMWGICRKDHRREYPPPIPLLVRTENLASHMPWVLKRHYTGDGRLILTEEKVRHHEFFRAHRSNGRLMLQLVAVDEQVSDESNVEMGDEDCEAAGGNGISMGMRGGEIQRLCWEWQCVPGARGPFEAKGKCQ